MKKMKRILAIICITCIAFGMVGCSRLQISREIATVNGRVITVAEFNYYLENVKQQMLTEAGTQDATAFWDAEIDGVKASEAAKTRALEEVLRVEMACIKAEEKGLSVPEDQLKQIKNSVNLSDKEQQAMYDELKKTTGLTDDLMIDLLTKTSLAGVYVNDIMANDPDALSPSEEELNATYNAEYVCVKHVLIGNTDEEADTSNLSEEDAAKAAESYKLAQQAKAEDVLSKAKAGSNFEALVRAHGEDPGMADSPNGYTFTKGAMVPEFEEASFKLAVGEISDLVESSYGWHIIKKYALPTSGDDYNQAMENVSSMLMEKKYNELLDSYKPEMTINIRQSVLDGIKVK
ncbi:MAG: peptidylprolyl isomerase [Clostridia bacterium]|nr:peptidylprolyl isomerase [Clostridia bacterium]